MKFTEIVCPNCGGDGKMQERGGEYVCGYCGKHFRAEYVDEQEALMKALGEAKRGALANARRNMYEAAHAENISSTQLVNAAREVKKYSPEDFMANFYETACNDDVRLVNKFLDEVDVQKEEKAFLLDICKFMLRSLSKRNVISMKDLVDRAHQAGVFTSGEYTECISRIEEEAKKIDDGVYDADLPRDVFVAYSSKDMAAVNELTDYLEEEKFTCFVALRNLRHGKGSAENYQHLLETAMMNCASVVFVSTGNSRDRSCDALRVELPFLRRERGDIYRIEYRPESDNGHTTVGAKIFLEEFFKDLEYARTREDVLKRLIMHQIGLDKSAPQPEPKPQPAPMPQSMPVPMPQPKPKPKAQPQPIPTPQPKPQPRLQSQPTPEDLYMKGKKYYDANDYDNAVIYFQKAAEQGLASAQNMYGECYYYGRGVTQNYAKAVEWYQKAAEQGNAEAQYSLGVCYYFGYGVQENKAKAVEWYTKAAEWYQKAAERGDAEAQYNLGECYFYGHGVPEDYAKAAEWYRKAAEQGNAEAQYMFGLCFFYGEGVPEDEAKAVEWYTKAAEQGHSDAKAALETLERLKNQTQLTAEELYAKGKEYYDADDCDNAVIYFKKAAEQGLASAQNELGFCYEWGFGVPVDEAKAFEWYRRAAEQGHAEAQQNLVFCYMCGRGVPEDVEKGVEWDRKVAEQGDAQAQYNLGVYYENGIGVPEDKVKAVEWYRKAAEQGFAEAQYKLGECYYIGEDVTQDDAKAVEWYQKAAEQGHAEAQRNLGSFYYNGKGVPQDYGKAVEWYRKSAEQGNVEAQNYLGVCYYDGKGVPKDYEKAVEWYRKAAEQGYAWAQYNLGYSYENGLGVPQDYVKAAEWYQKAVNQGSALAKEALERVKKYIK